MVGDLNDRLSAVDAAMNFQNHSKETMADAEEATEAARTQVSLNAHVAGYSTVMATLAGRQTWTRGLSCQ